MNGNNEASAVMNNTSNRHSTSHTATQVAESPSKEKGSGFLSFLSRLGGRRASIPHLPLLSPCGNGDDSNHTHVAPSPKSPLSKPNVPSTNSSNQNLPDVPALFVAYSQAIKAASLAALTVSSDTILRRNVELKAKEKDKKGRLIQRGRAGSKTEMEWTQKMFLLVPSMLLQYNADGAVDRMPEKILQLTSQSVAFASDIIPGKPYVLQVSQSAGADGSPIYEEKEKKGTLFSKLSLKHQTKQLAISFLLVFDSAKEMDSWMGLIRAEIAKLAGTYVPEKEQPRPIPRTLTRKITIRREEDDLFDTDAASNRRYSRISRSSRPSMDAGTSYTGTMVSDGQIALDNLRGGSSRVSIQSNGKVTIPTISPESSPERYAGRPESTPTKVENSRRRSMQALSTSTRSRTSIELRPQRPRPASSLDPSERTIQHPIMRTSSPIAIHSLNKPNISVNVGKRYLSGGLGITKASSNVRSFSLPNGGLTIDTQASLTCPQRRSSLLPNPTPAEDKVCELPKSPKSPRHSSRLDVPRRHRPVTLIDSKSSPDVSRLSLSPTASSFSNVQTTTPTSNGHNLHRKSMTALATDSSANGFSIGPPSHPPPSIPLPKLPQSLAESHGLRQSYHSGMTGAVISTYRNPKLGTRHSFHGVRPGGERYA